jgi:hypothetical protein
MSDQVLRRSERSEVLVTFPYRVILTAAVAAFRHQHRDLGAELGEFERTWIMSASPPGKFRFSIQAMAVIVAPAPAPASPKHATVDKVGYAPLVFAMTSGELPVAWYIQSSMAYLERWYMEKETVRTRVMLRRGDQTPVRMLARPGDT